MSSKFDAADSVDGRRHLGGDAGVVDAGAPRAFNSADEPGGLGQGVGGPGQSPLGQDAPDQDVTGQDAPATSGHSDEFGTNPGTGPSYQVPPYGAAPGYDPRAGAAPGYAPDSNYGSGPNYGRGPQSQSGPHYSSTYPRPPFGAAFFESLRASRWRRPQQRWVGGVCAAVAAQSGWDVALVRGITLVAALILGAPVAVAYALAWAFIPEQLDGRIHAESLLLGRPDVAHLGQALLLMSLFTPNPGLSFTLGNNDVFSIGLGFSAFILMLLVSAVILIAYRKHPRASSADSPPHSATNFDTHNYHFSQATYGASPYNTYETHTPYVPFPETGAAPAPGQAYPGQAYPGQAHPGQAHPGQAYPDQAQRQLHSFQQSLTRGPGLPTFLGILGAILVVASISYLVFLTMPEIYLGLYPMRDLYYLQDDGFLAFHAATVFTVATGFILGGVTLMVRALKGKPGTWLTALSAVLAFLWLPLFGILASL